ncbi:hypothetical protein NXV12_31180 [Bacteroides thetaiotaomicron]|nr:hypothetical protein [Bacteroides thetaiotaomicron]
MGRKIKLIGYLLFLTNVERWKQRTYYQPTTSTDGKNFSLMIAIGRKVKQRSGSRDMERIHTEWRGDNTDIYIRRTFDFNEPEYR